MIAGMATAMHLSCPGAAAGPRRKSDTASAASVWRRSITAGAEVPMRADMLMTYRRHGIVHTVKAHVVLGPHGASRVEFLTPTEVQGRVICSDGQSAWHYDPHTSALEETRLSAASEQRDRSVQQLIETNYRVNIVSPSVAIAGRQCWVLDLLPVHPGKSRQRRWIDRITSRTIRIETTYTDNVVARMVMYTPTSLPATITANLFVPQNGKTTHREAATITLDPHSELEAAKVPAKAPLGFRRISAAISSLDGRPAQQLLYTDGIETVSIFVQKETGAQPVPSGGWSKLMLPGLIAFQNTDHHVYALSWASNKFQFTAVSHITPEAMRRFVIELNKSIQ